MIEPGHGAPDCELPGKHGRAVKLDDLAGGVLVRGPSRPMIPGGITDPR